MSFGLLITQHMGLDMKILRCRHVIFCLTKMTICVNEQFYVIKQAGDITKMLERVEPPQFVTTGGSLSKTSSNPACNYHQKVGVMVFFPFTTLIFKNIKETQRQTTYLNLLLSSELIGAKIIQYCTRSSSGHADV